MKPDPVLEALEAVAAQFGRSDSRGFGLGLELEQIVAIDDFATAVLEEYKSQLIDSLRKEKRSRVGYDPYDTGWRMGLTRAIQDVESS